MDIEPPGMATLNDLTLVLYTADTIPSDFATNTRAQLDRARGNLPLVVIHRQPDIQPSHFNIYRQALEGAKQATTRYIALCEDDVLYSPEHFKYRPKQAPFAYNMNFWNVTTWGEPLFTQKLGGRRNLGQLICDREAFIQAMEERFSKYPNPPESLKPNWAEPSKYERQLGVTAQSWEVFTSNPPNIMFSHQTALSYQNLGERKKPGEIRATQIPHWGNVATIRSLYV